MITLPPMVKGIYEDLEPKIPKAQGIQYWGCWTTDNPAITISQLSDRRYALAKFSLDDLVLSCELMLFTKWWQQPLEFKIDIGDPKGFDKLCRWLYVEALDGLRYGWSGKHNDSFRLRLSTQYSRNPQPSLYHQKLIQFPE